MTLTTAITSWLNRRQAQSEIWDLDERAGAIMRHLSHPMDPLERAAKIDDLAWYEEWTAAAYARMGRTDDLAEVTSRAARMLAVIADSQSAVAAGWTDDDPAPEAIVPRGNWTPEQSAVFRDLCLTSDPGARADLIEGRFLDAWADEARAEAGEAVLSIARCERESARPGRRPWRPARARPAWAVAALRWARLIFAGLAALTTGAMAEAWAGTGWPSRTCAAVAAVITFVWLHPSGRRKGAGDA